MMKWVFASSCLLASVSMAQVIYYPPVIREFVDHPYNPRLTHDQVDRLRSLQEPAGQVWGDEDVYVRTSDGRRMWPVYRDQYKYGHRERLMDQPLYFRKIDVLPKADCEVDIDPEMTDVGDLAEPAAVTTPAVTTPVRAGDIPRGAIVIIPKGQKAAPTSDKGDRVSD
jgi:hypothetical protein